MIQETGAHAVKLEGADEVLEKISALTKAGIPVCGHLGLTPQSVGVLGGYKVQGKDAKAASKLLKTQRNVKKPGHLRLCLNVFLNNLADEVSKTRIHSSYRYWGWG